MKIFLAGMFFILVIYPIINGIISLFNQGIEYLCTCIAVKTVEKQKKLSQEEEPINTQVIGFQMPNEEYYYDDEGE